MAAISEAETLSVAQPRTPRLRKAPLCLIPSTRAAAKGTEKRVRQATISKAEAPVRSTAWKRSGKRPHMR